MRFSGLFPSIILILFVVFMAFGFSQTYNAFKGDYLEICEHDKAWATSTLKGPKSNTTRYHEHNLVDSDIKTAWVEGESGPGTDVKIIFEIPTPGYSTKVCKDGAATMIVYNGYCVSDKLFRSNNRVKDCTLEVFVGVDNGDYKDFCSLYKLKKYSGMDIVFRDTMEPQRFALNIDHKSAKELWRTTREQMRSNGEKTAGGEYGLYLFGVLTIKSVYKGSSYDDTCISEIGFE